MPYKRNYVAFVLGLSQLMLVLSLCMSTKADTGNSQKSLADRIWWVNKQHPSATDHGPGAGTSDKPFLTISQAALLAEPGDTVRVMAGVYRERVAPRRSGEPGRPIIYEAGVGQRVVISGSEVWRPDWEPAISHSRFQSGVLEPAIFAVDQRQAQDWPQDTFPRQYNPFALPLTDSPLLKGAAVDVYGDVQAGTQRSEPRRITLGQVFVDGKPMLHVADVSQASSTPGSFCVTGDDDDLTLHVHWPNWVRDPDDHLIEITARPRCFAPYRRGLSHIVVRGFIMEHGATDFPRGFYREGRSPQAGIVSTRGGTHWTIEHNIIRWGTSLGLDIGTEGKEDADGLGQPEPESAGNHVIRFNTITDHGAGGIHGIRAPKTLIAHNVIERTNLFGFGAPEIGAIKLHFFVDGRVEHNLIRDNDCFGIWLDNVWHRSRIHGNLLVNNQGAGFFIEMGHGPALIDHNIIAQTRGGSSTSGFGDALYAHDASGVTFAHNLTFFNAGHGLYAHLASDRSPWLYRHGRITVEKPAATCSRWRITGNLLIGDALGAVALPPESVYSQDNISNFNAFAGNWPRSTSETYASFLQEAVHSLPDNKGRIDLVALLERQGLSFDPKALTGAIPFEMWRTITRFDTDSRAVTVIRPIFTARKPQITFIIGPLIKQIEAPAVEFDHADWPTEWTDYFGVPRINNHIPGPFASIPIEPRLLRPEEINDDEWIPGRGPFNKVGNDRRFTAQLWPKPLQAE